MDGEDVAIDMGGQAGGQPAGPPVKKYISFCGCKCERNYAHLLHLAGILTCIGVGVFEFLQIAAKLAGLAIADMIVSFYIFLFALLCLLSELRFIDCWRKCSYYCVRSVYFVSTYVGRGLTYIFVGSLLFGQETVGYILGVACMVLGLCLIVLYTCFHRYVPQYLDKASLKAREQQADVGYVPPSLGDVGATAYLTPDNMATAAQFYQDNKQHLTRENIDRAVTVAQTAQQVQSFTYK